jgi:hypothetical protein
MSLLRRIRTCSQRSAVIWAGFVGLSFASTLSASGSWVKLTSKHVELYTPNSRKKAQRLLRDLERFRAVLDADNPPLGPDFGVRIVAFSSHAEYARYAPDPSSAGYFLPGHHRDYIVLQDLDLEHRSVALHEYAHFTESRRGVALPLWLDEGLAEVYSTLKEKDGLTVVGAVAAARLATLRTSGLADLRSLFAGSQSKLEYPTDPARLALFYAQSWALVHMLKFSPAYSAGFTRFLRLMGEGNSIEDSVREVYGKPLVGMSADLLYYLAETSLGGPRVTSSVAPDLGIEMQQASSVELNTVLGDLTATLERFDVARPMLLKLDADHPHTPQVEEALAYLFLRQNNIPEAGWYFSQAAADGDRNPRLLFHHARTMLAMGMSPSAVVPVLRRALEVEPNYPEARQQLASLLPVVAGLGSRTGNPMQSANIKGLR